MAEEEDEVAVMVEETYERVDNVSNLCVFVFLFELNIELVIFVAISKVWITRQGSWQRRRSFIWRDSPGEQMFVIIVRLVQFIVGMCFWTINVEFLYGPSRLTNGSCFSSFFGLVFTYVFGQSM